MKGRDLKWFYGVEGRQFTPNRFYKVYLSKESMMLARLAGQIFDSESASTLAAQGQIFAPLLFLYFNRLVRRRTENELKYDDMDLMSDRFLAEDSRNLRIPYRNLINVQMVPKRNAGAKLWAGHSTQGYLDITDMHGKRRRLYLTEPIDPSLTHTMIKEFIPRIEYNPP
ncbi:MAG: hypothetical protein AMXMBFR84_34170 [Candidatus Hydrogenedentota bacterium]